MKSALLASILVLVASSANAQSINPTITSWSGNCLTMIKSGQAPLVDCSWRRPTASGRARVKGHAGGCDATCQAKCDATWRAGGLPSVQACYTKWAKLNANPQLARACQYKSRQEQRRLGCGL